MASRGCAFRERAATLSAVLLDLTMPGMGGGEVLIELRRTHPTLPVIVVSGYDADDAMSMIGSDPSTVFLAKPFFADAPQRLLDQADAAREQPQGTDATARAPGQFIAEKSGRLRIRKPGADRGVLDAGERNARRRVTTVHALRHHAVVAMTWKRLPLGPFLMFAPIARLAVVASVAITLVGVSIVPRPLLAQSSTGTSTGTAQPAPPKPAPALRVFLDCRGQSGCALDYYIVELPFADWTRDRLFADVQLLVSTLTTGSGGTEWTVAFIGRERFAGLVDTLTVNTLPNASEDDIRGALSTLFVRGLYPFVKQTSLAPQFTINYTKPAVQDKSPTSVRDPWDFWTFETSINSFLNGEEQQRFTNLGATVEARRITNRWKLVAGVETEYNESRFTLRDRDGGTTQFTNILRNEGARLRTVRSITPRWSLGVVGSARRSDFLNTKMAIRGGPVVEVNLFPWKEATRRQLTTSYAVAWNDFQYFEPTVLGRTAEQRPSHVLTVATNVRQKWGSLDLSARGSQFLHDLDRYELSVGGSVRLQLVRGLALTLDGRYSRVRDQIYLPGAQLSNEEILVRQRALATGFQYFAFVGVSYTFGSIFNTIVNPRLDSFRLLGGSGF